MIQVNTKIHPPQKSRHLVSRSFLLQKLNQNPNRTLTLVSAPAGFGKTTLIASWLSDQPRPYAWISLDKFDNDLAVLLSYLVTAVCQVFPTAFPQLKQVLQVPDYPGANEMTALVINELGQLPQPLLLVLDDYHLITNPEILQLWERFLTHPQRKLHLIIISRMDPFLPLARLRLQGMAEIRQKDLQFSDIEAAVYLQTVTGAVIAADMASSLNGRLEGWISGLHLLALSMVDIDQLEHIKLKMYPEARHNISQYLFTEVFEKQPPDVQHFLLKTAFVDRFCSDLGDVLMSPIPSTSIFEHLQRANLFVVPLDEERIWFRYHHFFQQTLQQKAISQFDKETIGMWHSLAGDWLAENGLVDEALQHYLDADNVEAAISLIEAHSKNLLNGLARQRLERWITMLPEIVVWERPRLLIAKAWLFYRHWQLSKLTAVLKQIEHCLDENNLDLSDSELRFIRGQMYALQSAVFFAQENDPQTSVAAAKKALPFLPASEQGATGTATGYLALSLQAMGDKETAVALLQQHLNTPSPKGPAWVQLYLGLAHVHLIAGDLLRMKQITSQFMSKTAQLPVSKAAACWVSGKYHYEQNQLVTARECFAATVSLHYSTNFLAACDSWLALVRICQLQGDFYQAQTYLDEVRLETLRLENAELLAVVEAVQAYQHHLQGETAVALNWAHTFDPDEMPEWIMLSWPPLFFWARILTAHGSRQALQSVSQPLRKRLATAQSRHATQRSVQLLVHLACVHEKLGEAVRAQECLVDAVQLAQPGGFLRSFLDGGAGIRPLLQQLQQETPASPYLDQLLAAFSANGSAPQPTEEWAILLTLREREILQLMQDGLSNQEIAEHLVISLYTVKRHASNIYRKLDVNGRRQAVFKAKQTGILSP